MQYRDKLSSNFRALTPLISEISGFIRTEKKENIVDGFFFSSCGTGYPTVSHTPTAAHSAWVLCSVVAFFVVSCFHAAAANWARKLDSQPGPFARLAYPRLVRARSMAFRFRMLAHNNAVERRAECKGWGLFASGLICDFGTRVCVCVCQCVASWLNCGSSFRFCGSHNLCALYALPKSWLGGELELHLELLLCNVRMCAGGGWGAEWSGVPDVVKWELRQIRVAAAMTTTGSIVSGQNN